jgi:pimeloyl-ACP methyl ester carboxylesterase
MPHILYIHGANATPQSFNFIKAQLPKHKSTDVVYNAHDPLDDLIEIAEANMDGPTHIVGHSLGGIIAVALSQRVPDKVLSVSTLATPFGGSEAATRASILMPFDTFLRNINTRNPTLREIIQIGPRVPTMNVITTAGNNAFESRPNDGVVTIDSQVAFTGNIQYKVNLNHFEVLLAPATVNLIEGHVWLHDKS